MRKDISQAVIKRLPRYYRYLGELMEEGVERISSGELSRLMRVTASQIRQDLNNFGGFGQQGYGYNVRMLYNEIGSILGMDHTHHMIIVGGGNLGSAIANYSNFAKRGFIVEAIFDCNEKLIGKEIAGVKVRDVAELEEYAKTHDIDIAALTLPKTAATNVAKILVDLGVNAFLNFSHIDLNLPDNVYVENVHLSESLMRLSYRISNEKR